MRIRRAHVVALVAGGCLCLGVAAAGARPAAIACGSTLTTSTTLTADLVHCPGNGLVIGADGITVDLAGHTISGTNAAGSEGIANDGHPDVRILGGHISDFRVNGVGIRKARQSVVRGVTVRRIGAGGVEGEPVSAGIAVVDSPRSQIIGNDVSNDVKAFQSDGADVLNSPGSVVRRNRLNRNAWNGLALIASAGSRVTGNEFSGNSNNGTEVNGHSDAVVVTGNRADRNKRVGIVLGAAVKLHVAGNSARANDTGFFFFDLHDSAISANRASGNRDGIDLSGGQAGSNGNRLVGNVASRNSASGIGLSGRANDNVVARNVANGNLGAPGKGGGIAIQASTGNRLTGNVANGNRDTGIVFNEDVAGDTTGNVLERNTASRNRNHGIDATPGSVDAGGNRARGNAVAPQCQNVFCSR
jgi:parallel beta-helix repeat protein